MPRQFAWFVVVGAALALCGPMSAAAQTPPPVAADPPRYDPDEPLAKEFSLAKSAEYLDAVAAFWMKKSEPAPKGNYPRVLHSCGSCHANFAYMMARPLLLKEKPESLLAPTRRWMEHQVATLECSKSPHLADGAGKYHFPGAGPTLAVGLVFHDLHAGGELQATTRKALTKMWQARQVKPTRYGNKGSWCVDGFCWDLSVPELDAHYSAALAAIAVGVAPQGYARSEEAKVEIARFREDFATLFDGRGGLHAQALALWASGRLDGWMSETRRGEIVRSLLAAQCADGGWSLAKLGGRWHGGDTAKSDGYATGLVVYVLRQEGLPAERPEITRGVTWLKKNQRASGGWFTPNADRDGTLGGMGSHDLAILNLGTAYAVMALHACEKSREGNSATPMKVP